MHHVKHSSSLSDPSSRQPKSNNKTEKKIQKNGHQGGFDLSRDNFFLILSSLALFFFSLTQNTTNPTANAPAEQLWSHATFSSALYLVVGLLSEGASFCQSSFATRWLGEHNHARRALDDGLGVGEDGRDVHAAWAFDIHEVGVWCLHETLELVGGGLGGSSWVEKINNWHVCLFVKKIGMIKKLSKLYLKLLQRSLLDI